MLNTSNLDIRVAVDEYLKYVKEAGFEIVSSGNVSAITKTKLQMELIRPEEYVKMMNI